VLLNIGSAHLGMLGTREQVAAAKGELIAALPARGTAVLNADDALVRARAESTAARTVLFGRAEDADVRATDVVLDAMARAAFMLRTAEGAAPVTLAVHGEHFVANALAVAAVAGVLGMGVAQVAERLSLASIASSWRMEITETPDGVIVINDTYNANPESMRAALETLAVIGAGGRTWAVLGEMLELGPDAAAEHRALGGLAAALGVAQLLCVGPGARFIAEGFTRDLDHAGLSRVVEDPDAAIAVLQAEVRSGDSVLVKASRGVGLDRVAAAITERDNA
ncbi:MAG: Mur ligase family protein, partial [Candidatus Nanopelagicales bacterium]|nr:Mur ligase family protein [Candidatus Nanopelagicales bacterium]